MRWKSPEQVSEPLESRRTFGLAEVEIMNPLLVQLLQETGIPDLEGTPREKAVALLQMAAEVEHSFVVQYLYGAFSLDRTNQNGMAWNQVLFGIAEEEMGHLATAQNLLALLGEPPHLDRQSFPAPPTYPFEKILKVFALDWLGDFVIAESPKGAALPPGVPPAPNMARVGTIYMNLYWLFKESEQPGQPWPITNPGFSHEHLGDSDLANPAELTDWLMTTVDWGQAPVLSGQPMAGFRILSHGPFGTRADERLGALEAIYDVAAQGEGPIPQANSHFERLSRLYMSASALATLPCKNISDNPHTTPETTGNPELEEGLITYPVARKLATLFNLRYAMLLTEIGHVAQTPRTLKVNGEVVRKKLAQWAIHTEMHFIAALADSLNAQPLKATKTAQSDTRASAPFELPEGFPSNDRKRWQLYLNVFDQTKAIVTELGDAVAGLSQITGADDARRPFILDRLGRS